MRKLWHSVFMAAALCLLAAVHAPASYSTAPPAFEQTDPDFQLANNPHPSLPELIQGLEERSLKQPDDAEVWYQLGLSYAKADRGSDAIDALHKAVGLDPVHVRAWENLGVNLYFANRSDEALAAFKRATDLGASNFEVWNDYGVILMQKGRLPESSDALDRGFKLNPQSTRLWNSRGILKEKQNDVPGAIDAFNQALKIDPNYSIGWCNLGLAQAMMNDDDSALASFQKAVQLDAKFGVGWINVSLLFAKRHQWKEAFSAAQSAVQFKPTDTGGWYVLGHADYGLAKYNDAEAEFQKAFDVLDTEPFQVQGDHVYGDSLSEYGLATITIGHYDDADKILAKALQLDPNGPRVLAAIGELRMRQQRWAESADLSQKSLDIDPTVSRTWGNLGTARMGLNRPPAESLQAFEKATQLQPGYSYAWFKCGQCNELLKNNDEAAQDYRKTVEFTPTFVEGWRRLAFVTTDTLESDKAMDQAISLNRGDISTYLYFGEVEVGRKNWPDAQRYDRTATDIDPTNGTAWAQLGQALSAQKDYPGAVEALDKAVQFSVNIPPEQLAKWWSALALAHISQGNAKGQPEWQAGLDAATHATTADPSNPVYWYEMALAQKGLGRGDDIKVSLAKIQQLGGLPWMHNNGQSAVLPAPTTNAPGTSPETAATNPTNAPSATPVSDADKAEIATVNAIKQMVRDHQADQAIAAAQHETDAHPDNWMTWYCLGDVYLNENRYGDAVAPLTKATELNPKSGPTWLDLGSSLAAQQEIDPAIEALTKSVNFLPNVPFTWIALGRCYAARHDITGAADKIGDMAAAHPDSPFGWWMLGEIQNQQGLPVIALETMQKAADLNPAYAPLWNDLGMTFGNAKQPDKAQEFFNRAIQLQPDYADALNNLGYSYFLAGQTDKAIGYYKQALQSSPKHPRALYNLVTAYARENQWDQARQACANLAQVDPHAASQLSQGFPKDTSGSAASPPAPTYLPTP